MRTISVTYHAHSWFEIPDDVFLLTEAENMYSKNGDYGSWWIKYNVLFYYDKDGKEHEIEGSNPEVHAKRPESIDADEILST